MRIFFTRSIAEAFAKVIANTIKTKSNLHALSHKDFQDLIEYIREAIHNTGVDVMVVITSKDYIERELEKLYELHKNPKETFMVFLCLSNKVLFHFCSRDPSVF
jgi:succinate dehydrogenase/fumarate reductase flavoprotein subunit